MCDILMDDTPHWQLLEQSIKTILTCYGYQEIRLPTVEKTKLFSGAIGDHTDIVSKEMYCFDDRSGESLSLRPEGTASCVRAGIEHGLLYNQTQRLWYAGAMFRYERPQKGRQRQFHQIGVETFGFQGPDIDAELILLSARIWRLLDIKDMTLHINSLGSEQERQHYKTELVHYFNDHEQQLDEDSQRRLKHNPLRILDSKNPDMQSLITKAPSIQDHLGAESQQHFSQFCELLKENNINYKINSRLVRGLDYYNNTVFEWTNDQQLGAQDAVCAGGRYDNLVSQHGGAPTPAAGFAIGLERLLMLQQRATKKPTVHAYLVHSGTDAMSSAINLVEKLRDQIPELNIICHCGGGSLKSQFKKADKSGALYALILGELEIEQQCVGLKFLRDNQDQQTLNWYDLVTFLSSAIKQ